MKFTVSAALFDFGFAYGLAQLVVSPEQRTFVGDELAWDIEASIAMGMNGGGRHQKAGARDLS